MIARLVSGFLRFWWDFVVGDDWKIAAGVVSVLGAGALLAAGGIVGSEALAVLAGAGVMAAFTLGLLVDVRRRG